MDKEVQVLFDNMQKAGILGCVDVIVLSDHGMAPAPAGEKFLIMENYVPDIVSSSRIYDGVLPNIRPHLDTEGMLSISFDFFSFFYIQFTTQVSVAKGKQLGHIMVTGIVNRLGYDRQYYQILNSHRLK